MHYTIYCIKEQLIELESLGYNIQFIWIPGHVGVLGNDVADYLAKIVSGINENNSDSVKELDKFYAHNLFPGIRNGHDTQMFNALNERSTASISCYRYFNRVREKYGKPWFNRYTNLTRKFIVLINRLRSDHTRLNNHLFRKNIINDPNCPCGTNIQTTDHVFFECSLYIREIELFMNT